MKNRMIRIFEFAGLNWFIPVVRLFHGENPAEQWGSLWRMAGIPLLTFAVFLGGWATAASRIDTSLGKVPGPSQVFSQAGGLLQEHSEERVKRTAFYEREKIRIAAKKAKDVNAKVKVRKYTGKPTYLDQIVTSLFTVFTGFLIASLIAVPIGILCGLSRNLMTAISPLIQIFKPVSPVAWLPIVTMIVSALYTTRNGMFEKSFIISAVTVALCSLWPTLINTALGVSSIDKDYMNVARVLQLKFSTQIFKIVLPATMPYIFAGLRISLGVGWMVLIAAEMLAQNPGLGKFVWDEFQNGSSYSLARIMVAVFTIGLVGSFLDSLMVLLQKTVSFNQNPTVA